MLANELGDEDALLNYHHGYLSLFRVQLYHHAWMEGYE